MKNPELQYRTRQVAALSHWIGGVMSSPGAVACPMPASGVA